MKKLTLLFALSTLTMQAFSALTEKKMKYILIIFATFILSGCFDPTFDASSTDSRRDSYSKMLESLPENERSKFDELVVYYLQEYEIAGVELHPKLTHYTPGFASNFDPCITPLLHSVAGEMRSDRHGIIECNSTLA